MMTTLPADHLTATGTSPAPRGSWQLISSFARGSKQGPPDNPSAPQEAGGEEGGCVGAWGGGEGGGRGRPTRSSGWGPLSPAAQGSPGGPGKGLEGLGQQ